MARSPFTSIPNLLTIGRIIAIPVTIVLLLAGDPTARWIAFVLYALAAFTDWLDGYLARAWNETSPLGRMLDPIADKMLVGALLIALAFDHTFSALDLVPATLILMREILVSGLREFLGPQGVVVHVTQLAKWKTTVQLVALGVVILEPVLPILALPGDLLLWLAAGLTVWTGAEYFGGAWPHLVGDGR